MTGGLDDLGWFLIAIIGLAVLQRRLHYEIQALLFILTKRIDLSMTIFAILFLPGVLIHELSHYGMARLLNVPVGSLSLIPQPLPDGRMRLGYVETKSTDFFRDALIGAAPLIVGSFVVAYAGLINLQFSIYWAEFSISDLSPAVSGLSRIVNQQAGLEILETGIPGSIGWGGISIWLYTCSCILCVPWFVILYDANFLVFLLAIVVFLMNLFFLQWKLPE